MGVHSQPENRPMKNPLLSVIVPVYNVEDYLANCLDSIVNQSYQNLEIICVDDGSTDKSPEILKEYAAKDSRIVVIHQQNAGLAAARNTALDYAHGEYVAGVDSDDHITHDCYEKAIACFSEGVDMVVFGIKVDCSDPSEQEAKQKYFTIHLSGHIKIDNSNLPKFLNNFWNKVYKRRIIEQYHLRFPNGCWYEDIPFTYRYLSIISDAYAIPDQMYVYLKRPGSIMAQTVAGHERALDILGVVEMVYEFYVQHGLWSKFMPQVKRLAHMAFTTLNHIDADNREKAAKECQSWVRKWNLHRIFPDDARIQEKAGKTFSEKLWSLIRGLFYRTGNNKWKISILGIPLISKRKNENESIYSVLGIPVFRRKKNAKP